MTITDISSGRRQITAAAVRFDDLEVGSEMRRQLVRHDKWQELALGFNNTIGEVHYTTTMTADALAKGRLYPAARPEPDAERVRADDPDSGVPLAVAELAEEKLRAFKAPIGGQAQLIRMAAINTLLAGEWYLLNYPGPIEAMVGWHVRSIRDVSVASTGMVKVDGLGEFADDEVARIWNPDPANFMKADSGMRAVLGTCETVLLCDRQFRAGLRSRLFAGLLLLSNGFREGPPDPSTSRAGDGEAPDDPVIADILQALSLGIQDEGAASAVVPNTLWGRLEDIKDGARLLSFAQQVDEAVVALREAGLRRIAQGLDAPPEIVLGTGDINHWGQWFVGESFVQHVEPKAAFLEDAFTTVYLRPELVAEGVEPEIAERIEAALDLTPLMRRPNGDEDAKHAYSVGELNGEGLRRALGISEDFAPEADDDVRWLVLNKAQFGQTLTGHLLRKEIIPDLPDLAPEAPGGQEPGTAPGGEPNSPPIAAAAGIDLAALDAALTERLLGATLAAFHRALERAGNRARAKVTASYRASVKGLAAEQVVSQLGPSLLAAAGITEEELLAGALEQLRPDFDRWVAQAQASALADAVAFAPDDPDPETLAEIASQQAEDREAAWEWFAAAVLVLLAARMADGAEVADWEVRSLVRQALARAGGAGAQAALADATVTTVPEGSGTGVATGPVVLGLLATLGVAVAAWEWNHGEPARPFPDHVDLNGRVESSRDDFDGFYPGDHAGCTCALIPTLEVP